MGPEVESTERHGAALKKARGLCNLGLEKQGEVPRRPLLPRPCAEEDLEWAFETWNVKHPH